LSHNACYELHTDAKDFDSAEYTCTKKGGHLTSVGSAFANSFIRRLAENVTADRLWIGGHYGGENDDDVLDVERRDGVDLRQLEI
ncbi:hypothetical protein AAVH_36903, partial [Aphelenchoides avenae]